MTKLKNERLVATLDFLTQVELPPKASRVRTKLIKRLQVKIDELYKDEIELLEKFGMKDENGTLVQHEGSFSLVEATAETYHQEKQALLQEAISLDVAEIKDKFPILIETLENSEVSYSGNQAELLDFILEQLENEMEEVK
ncbi:DUF1617 family protein [Lactococcus kimchii]|uniref:DUF1617 family protein n=1 Tax=Lactococcus sp. S-13 TaxID=2507158 RepID=UPI0010237643|nr:DUF1617 family protein [Lactococcus sp. S-13]RZI48260.1 DUF1617 family protein [Lactococcus sp. S-13]